MSLSPNEKYPGATEADPNYKDSKFKDNNPSTTNNGSPLKALDRNEQLALQEAMMNAAGFDYNGVVDTPQNSQMFNAYKAALSNGANLLSNHNFIIASPDDSQPAPSATPTSYPPGFQIFSGVFANETTGILNLTYIDGRVSFSGGDFYMAVPNTGALENITEFVASVADFDGKPRTRGVSYALVGDEYRVTVGIDALEDEGANETLLGSVKFEQGSVATGHEVGLATKKQFQSISSMIAGASVGDKCSSGSTDWKRISSSNGDLSDFIALNGVWSKDFGVQAVDTYDSTTELQDCIDSVSDNSTVHVEHPCSFGQITVSKSLSIKGFRANKSDSLIKLVGANAGFVSSGRIIELNYKSMYYECDGDLTNRQIPQSVGSGSDIDEISYKDCYAKNCVVGLSMAFESGRVLRKKGLIEDCEVDTTVGIDPGEGYGVHCANDRQVNGYDSKIYINRNLVDKATRHSIYASRSGGYTITNNHVKNHRMSVFDGNLRPAILVGRASDTVGYGNTYEDCYGVCLAIVPETVGGVTYDCTSVHFNDETFINPKELAPVAFGLSARNGGEIIGSSVRNSTFRMNDNSIPVLLSYYGFDLNFQGNDIVYRGVGAVDLFVMVGVDESNYSTLHSDNWDFSRNNVDIYTKTGSINSYKITQNIGARINLDNEIIGGDTTLVLSDPSMTQNRITLNGTRFLSVGISDPVGNITPYKIGERIVLLAPDPDTVWLATGDTDADWIKLG